MRNRIGVSMAARFAAIAAVLLGSVALVSAPTPPSRNMRRPFSPTRVSSHSCGRAWWCRSNPPVLRPMAPSRRNSSSPIRRGLPLDRTGTYTPGAVSTSFIAATIPAGQEQYTAYTTRVQKSPINGVSATQAGTDAGGTYQQVGDGEYVYTFHTKAPATIDRNATHSIGVYSSRDLSDFDLGTSFADNVYNFVPNGTAVVTTRDVVRTAACNTCHDPLSAHGGARRAVELCVLCHTPQTTDPIPAIPWISK